ncbi:MAG: helix-turn-helix transcriptional regulator [Deltaproteobacteria bacterium]|nr:MAG: helix-turn-helix transcriptional regulator [Deltaproteobacteria bacterium]
MNTKTTEATIELAGRPPDMQMQHAVIGALPGGKLRRVMAYIQSNLHRELRLAELSAVVHMSPYHFARFVVHRRMDASIALLTTSTSSISSIARAVGFKTASHFATTFRRLTGVTPSAYQAGRAGVANSRAATSSARHSA